MEEVVSDRKYDKNEKHYERKDAECHDGTSPVKMEVGD